MAKVRHVDLAIGGMVNIAELFQGVGRYAENHGPWRFIQHVGAPQAVARDIRASRGEGLITGASIVRDGILPSLLGVEPVVGAVASELADRTWAVLCEDVAIGRLAAEHLLELGLERFAYFGCDQSWSREREAGFVQRLDRAGQGALINGDALAGGKRPTIGQVMEPDRIDAFLSRLEAQTGLMVASDPIAVEVLEACDRLGLRVPSDLAIIAVNNNEVHCRFGLVPLTSVDRGLFRMGYLAAEMLDVLMAGGKPAQHVVRVPPAGIVKRRSTDLPLRGLPELSAALHYIADHAGEGIDVEDVAREVSMTRRTLERRFRDALGRTPGEEIRRQRLRRARRLISGTDLPLARIALDSGFATQSAMGRAFRRRYGTTPDAFRRQSAPER